MIESRTTTPDRTTDPEDSGELLIDAHPEYAQALNGEGELQLYRINPDGSEEWILDEDAFLAEQGVADRHSKAELAAQSAARNKHAALVDKVKGPVYRKERREELLDKYKQSEDEYLDAVYKHAYEQVEKAVEAGDIDVQDIDAVRAKVQATVNDHLSRTQHDEQKEVLKSGGWKGKLLGKYAKLSRGKKIAVGLGIGVVGAGAGVLLGAAGAASAVVAGGLAGTRFARGYYTRIADMYAERTGSRDDSADIVLSGEDPNQWLEQISETFKTYSAEDIARYESIRKRAIKGAVGAVALGASIGAAAGVIGDRIGESGAVNSDKIAQSREWARQWWSPESEPYSLADNHESVTEGLGDGGAAKHLPDQSGSIEDDVAIDSLKSVEGEGDIELSDAEKLALALEHQLSQPFTVEAGHGYTHELIQALDALGVDLSPEEAYELHKTLVDQVGHQYISGDVYHMGGDQYQWGIGAPGETTWDPRAVEIISQYAVDHGAAVEGMDQIAAMDNPELADESDAHADLDTSENAVDANEVTDDSDAEERVDEDEAQAEKSAQEPSVEQQIESAQEVTTDGFDEAIERNESLYAMQGDIHEIINQIDAGNIEAINNNPMLQKTLMYLQRDLQDVYYPGTSVKLVSFDEALGGRWVFNPIPEGSRLPADEIINYLNAYELRISSQS